MVITMINLDRYIDKDKWCAKCPLNTAWSTSCVSNKVKCPVDVDYTNSYCLRRRDMDEIERIIKEIIRVEAKIDILVEILEDYERDIEYIINHGK